MVASKKGLLTLSLITASLMGVTVSMTACERLPFINPEGMRETSHVQPPLIIDAKLSKATTIINCAPLKPKQTVTVKGHSALSNGCDLTGKSIRFELNHSNSSLDCRGARLSTTADDPSKASAITIKPKADVAIDNIAVANCHVEGYGHALHIRQYSNPNERYARGFISPAANRALAPSNIRVINVSSRNSINSGMFVGDHVHDITFDKVHIQNAGTVGLYLEFGSRDNVIKNSVFVGNGFRTFKPNREAIAVDSSSNNRIANNQFIHNGAGSILLYRNCFEHADDPTRGNHFKRTESSRDNIIANNNFEDEPVGVWVASRQSRNLKGFECGAYLVKQTPFASYHLDSAKDNQIINNRFGQVEQGIIVEDDGTLIKGNKFAANVRLPISVGSEIREQSTVGAIMNTQIKNNTFIDKSIEQAIEISAASKTATHIE
ncbi:MULTISPECIES: right-handed parallel beta-helix repeat-containing protein [unclassified Psychrobacter]|uniref:right-handed parallel beta-helix repeat-containing protein n=1 Tax=unclassified Psychrobacter TaxID=196806 RepID=UPI00188A56C1|nr:MULTISPECIES: right-handed parallel beta-helix repeat-containing protein [unclassified Psychrobacter]MBF4490865.1 right-handed parallel beta-helix repeat-containing protein [Psychrobacter sp. N25K4-3-2]